jgi:single-strand DNA-binding protein
MVNITVLQGRLTADPEIRTVGENKACDFTVAWSNRYKNKEKKCFLKCTVWNGTAEFMKKYFHKGQEITVSGQLVQNEWEDEKGKHYQLVLENVQPNFCGGKSDNTEHTENTETTAINKAEDVDDLPF